MRSSIMLREAKQDLLDGIYIHFLTDSSLFNLGRLLARTKTNEELITGPLFADDCALLAHTEEALQHIVNHVLLVMILLFFVLTSIPSVVALSTSLLVRS